LLFRNVGIVPLKIVSTIGATVASEACVQNDEVKPASIERVMRFRLADPFEKLVLRKRRDAVVAQDVVLVARQSSNLLVDPAQVLLLNFD